MSVKVCTAEQMRKIDATAETLGAIPSIVLMENAAIACAREIIADKSIKKAAIFCGRGNNGGDGFAIARHLKNSGIAVSVYLVLGTGFTGDALTNFEIISRMGIDIKEIPEGDMSEEYIRDCDIVVDAIFGTGIQREITGNVKEVVGVINEYSKYTMSVDIPSGVDADTGKIWGACIRADVTVTFAAYKRGLLLYPGAEYAGEIRLADISIPEYIIREQNINVNVITDEVAAEIRPKRPENSHKGDFGKVLIVAGSLGMSGAAALATRACLKSGAGLITVAAPDCIVPILEEKLTEPMTMSLPSKNGGLSVECTEILKARLNDFDVCLFGPGLGRDEDIQKILRDLLKATKIPFIIDADGLYALSCDMSVLDNCGVEITLTPHEMEMARLAGCDVEYVSKNRLELSQVFAVENSVNLVLKGHRTVVTSFDGTQYINIRGNSGMATGGSGDVLAGMVAAFSASSQMSLTNAAILGVYLHSLSGDIAADRLTCEALTPTDMTENISEAFKFLQNLK